MKRAHILSLTQLVISPVILIGTGHSPQAHIFYLSWQRTSTEIFLSAGVVAVWGVWFLGCIGFVIGLTSNLIGHSKVSTFIVPSYLVLTAASLVGAIGWRTTDSKSNRLGEETKPQEVDHAHGSVERVRSAALAGLAGFILRAHMENLSRILKRARRGATYEPHSRITQLVHHRLIAQSKPSFLDFKLVRSVGASRSAENEINQSDLYLPIGFTNHGITSVVLGRTTTITVKDASTAGRFIDYLLSIARLITMKNGSVELLKRELDEVDVQIVLKAESIRSVAAEEKYVLSPVCGSRMVQVEPSGTTCEQFVFSSVEREQLERLIEESFPRTVQEVREIEPVTKRGKPDLLVRMMGPIEIVRSDGMALQFRKSKSEELLAWLVLHRDRPLREVARTALWDHGVEDATFNNVLSELRRTIRDAVPGIGFEDTSLRRSISIPFGISTDVDELEQARNNAYVLRTDAAWGALHEAVARIRGLPFEGARYDWADAEGLTSHIVLKIMNACADLAEHYLEIGDVNGVYFATSQGLRALPGSEEMIELRSRAMINATTVRS